MEFEEILEFESDLNSKHSDLKAAKNTFKILASDERKLKRLKLKLLALDVDVSSIDSALAIFKSWSGFGLRIPYSYFFIVAEFMPDD